MGISRRERSMKNDDRPSRGWLEQSTKNGRILKFYLDVAHMAARFEIITHVCHAAREWSLQVPLKPSWTKWWQNSKLLLLSIALKVCNIFAILKHLFFLNKIFTVKNVIIFYFFSSKTFRMQDFAQYKFRVHQNWKPEVQLGTKDFAVYEFRVYRNCKIFEPSKSV